MKIKCSVLFLGVLFLLFCGVSGQDEEREKVDVRSEVDKVDVRGEVDVRNGWDLICKSEKHKPYNPICVNYSSKSAADKQKERHNNNHHDGKSVAYVERAN